MGWYLTDYTANRITLPNVVLFPVVYEGTVYGIKSRPFTTSQYVAQSYASNTMYNYYYAGNTQILRGTGSREKIYCTINGKTMGAHLVYSSSTETIQKFTLLSESNISGRFRITPSCTEFPYSYSTCPVDFAIDGVLYNAIGVPNDSTTTIYVYKYNTDGSIAQDSLATSGVVSQKFLNSIVDFGVAPQNIPTSIVNWINTNFNTIYNNTFTVKNQDGTEEFYKLIEAPAMVKGYLTVISTTKTLVLTGVNDEEYTLTWVSQNQDGKQFNGISFSPNSKVANIPIGVETYFNLEGDVTLYECYNTYRPPVTAFNINLYKNTAESNRVDKTNYLTKISTISGVMRNESSITNLIITFETAEIPTFNYVYIPIFNRYYFVNDITSIKYKMWQMSLSVDPLMSYKNAILNCIGFIDRNENDYNPNIIDKKRAVEQGDIVEVDNVSNDLFVDSTGSYVLNGILVSAYSE